MRPSNVSTFAANLEELKSPLFRCLYPLTEGLTYDGVYQSPPKNGVVPWSEVMDSAVKSFLGSDEVKNHITTLGEREVLRATVSDVIKERFAENQIGATTRSFPGSPDPFQTNRYAQRMIDYFVDALMRSTQASLPSLEGNVPTGVGGFHDSIATVIDGD